MHPIYFAYIMIIAGMLGMWLGAFHRLRGSHDGGLLLPGGIGIMVSGCLFMFMIG